MVIGAANLRLHCDLKPGATRSQPCNEAPYSLHIVGDSKSCYRRSDGTWKLEIATTGSTADGIMVLIDNFKGAGTYALDDPYKRFLKLSDTTTVASCVNNSLTGPPIEGGKSVSSPGGGTSCSSSGCTLTLAETQPAAPDRYDISVTCPDVCESNTNLICKPTSGPVTFRVTADCPPG